jgi:O-acetyl-ADP-ribose deacetylase (regulator of RNase III)
MPTTFVKGDIFAAEEAAGPAPASPRAFALSVDTSAALDSGIAIAFRKRWPALGEALAGKRLEVGQVFSWRGEGVVVYALALSAPGKKAKTSTLERALRTTLALAANDGVKLVLLPRIGTGAAGLDWKRVKRVLDDVGSSTDVSLVVYEQFVRSKEEPHPEG